MDVCYPFRENFEAYSKPEGAWAGFEEAIEEAKEFERTGQFIMVPSVQAVAEEEDSEESEPVRRKKRAPARKRRAAHGSDDDENFGESDDDGRGHKSSKRGARKPKKGAEPKPTKKPQRTIRANREQKLFAREIFGILKQIEKSIEEKNLDGALALLKRFDPKTMTKRLNKDGLTVDAPGPFAQIESQVVHISRLGKFVHGLTKHHADDIIGPYAQTLYRHLRANALRELAVPDEIEAYISNQDRGTSTTAKNNQTQKNTNTTTTEPSAAESNAMEVTTETSAPVEDTKPNETEQGTQTQTNQIEDDSNGHSASSSAHIAETTVVDGMKVDS